jgi:hypothetical protein
MAQISVERETADDTAGAVDSGFSVYVLEGKSGLVRQSSLEDLPASLDDGARALIVYSVPIQGLAAMLGDAVGAAALLDAWAAQCRQALDLAARHDSRMLLCDRDGLFHPETVQVVADRFDGAKPPHGRADQSVRAEAAAAAWALLRCHDEAWALLCALDRSNAGGKGARPGFAEIQRALFTAPGLSGAAGEIDQIMAAQIAELRSEAVKAGQEAKQARQEADEASQAAIDCQLRLSETEAELELATIERDSYRGQFEAIKASTFWRVTAPLRGFLGLFRRG